MDILNREINLRRAEEELHLLQRLSLVISEAPDFHSALRAAISSICEATGWTLAEVWVPSPGGKTLELNFGWHCEEGSSGNFIEQSRGFKFMPGVGLPGRVWQSRKPEWISDVSVNRFLFVRHQEAAEAGLKAALGVPIISGEQTLAVLIFFMRESRSEDRRLVDLVAAVSAQLGNVLQRKQAEEARLELQRRYEELFLHSQKMEAISQLAGGIAHDFNNAFTAIIGFGTLLLMRLEDNPELKGYAEQILAVSEKSSDIVRELLAFSRAHGTSLWPADLNELVRDIMNRLPGFLGEGISIESVLADHKMMVNVDHLQMEEVMVNLASNARDAMPEGGTVTIRTGTVTLDDNLAAGGGYGRVGEYAVISFEDTGTGMDEETKKRIYEPFFSTKGDGKGTGLGLSTVYGIIKYHDGFITVDSEPGRGSVFKIFLPLLQDGSQEIAYGTEK